MRDFNWGDNHLYAVIKENGNFAGLPCRSYEEARELANQHEGAHIFSLKCVTCLFDTNNYKPTDEPWERD